MSKFGVMSMAILFCKGTLMQKCMILYDILEKNVMDDNEHDIMPKNKSLELIITCLFEFSIISMDRYLSGVNKQPLWVTLYEMKDKNRKRLINMKLLKCLKDNLCCDPKYQGFNQCLFEKNSGLSRAHFIQRLQHPSCNWIFDMHQIRSRFQDF